MTNTDCERTKRRNLTTKFYKSFNEEFGRVEDNVDTLFQFGCVIIATAMRDMDEDVRQSAFDYFLRLLFEDNLISGFAQAMPDPTETRN